MNENERKKGIMKRSKINETIRKMEQLIKVHGFEIPPFCKWTPSDWENKNEEYDEIRDNEQKSGISPQKMI